MEDEVGFKGVEVNLLDWDGQDEDAVDHGNEDEVEEDCVVSFSNAGTEP